MPRRIVAVALPHLAAELCLRRAGQSGLTAPFAVIAETGNTVRLASVNRAAAGLGLAPGLPLADARAICPGLITRPQTPGRLGTARQGLARWAERFSPIAAMEGDALILDATGCAHLFGGEAAMLDAIAAGLADLGLTATPAMADTKGAAWALAFFARRAPPPTDSYPEGSATRPTSPPSHRSSLGAPSVAGWGGGAGGLGAPGAETAARNYPFLIAPHGQTRAAIAELPVAALRIAAEAAEGLTALGLATIGEAARIPRGTLARRFGLATLKRLDQALGSEPEPVAPDRPLPVFATRLTLPEPIGHQADVLAGLTRLLERLCILLETHQMGARALRLTARRADGGSTGTGIRLARPGRDPVRLAALFTPKLEELEAGFGLDALRLEATATEPLKPVQTRQVQVGRSTEAEKLAYLLSRIGNRIGFENLIRLLPAESHIPERAFTEAAAAWSEPESFPAGRRRPLVLFPPERVEMAHTAPFPGKALSPPPSRAWSGQEKGPVDLFPTPRVMEGGPPAQLHREQDFPRFRWRGRWLRPLHAQGPERIAPEWWWDDPAWRSGTRDYWQVETAEGPRLWLFHTPQAARPDWWVHGEFP